MDKKYLEVKASHSCNSIAMPMHGTCPVALLQGVFLVKNVIILVKNILVQFYRYFKCLQFVSLLLISIVLLIRDLILDLSFTVFLKVLSKQHLVSTHIQKKLFNFLTSVLQSDNEIRLLDNISLTVLLCIIFILLDITSINK